MNLGYFSAGDSPFFFQEQLQQLSWMPKIWDGTNGFGKSVLVQLWIDYPIRLFIKLFATLGFDWWAIDKILWLLTFFLALISIYRLTSYLSMSFWQRGISLIIYLSNTYALMLIDGGQRGVLLAYAFAPMFIYYYLRLIDTYTEWIRSIREIVRTIALISILLGIFIAFDLRIAYLGIIAAGIYFLIRCYINKTSIKEIVQLVLLLFIFPLIGASLLHAFWILPLIGAGSSVSLGEEYTSAGMLKFLSVADFSHAISLLHPNWPENLFGKVYFLQPEFLILPILAFSSLVSQEKKEKISSPSSLHMFYFAIVSLVGAFFSKGVQEPFGIVFSWMFDHIPGFVMFRDPTKFYWYIALGFSILIPLALKNISIFVANKYKNMFVVSIFIVFWMILLRPVFLGKLSGNFKPKNISSEYIQLKNTLVQDTTASRVLWLPTYESFHFASDIHPVLTGEQLFKTSSISGLLSKISSPEFHETLDVSGIKYIVIPIDVWERIYLNEYKYDSSQPIRLVNALGSLGYVPLSGYTSLHVFINHTFHFNAIVPDYIVKQEYFMNIGLLISVVFCALYTFVLLLYRKK